MPCRLMWHDGLQNDRGVLKYFMHFYPCSHLKETLEATNANFEAAGITQLLTEQEYCMHSIWYHDGYRNRWSEGRDENAAAYSYLLIRNSIVAAPL